MEEQKRRAGSELRGLAEQEAEQGRTAAGGRLEHVARALEVAADSLEEEGEPGLGHVAEDLADRANRASRYLQDRDVTEIVDELETRARGNPGSFLAGSAIAGVLIVRFLRSSNRAPGRHGGRHDGVGGDDHG